jgi:hypothetical protein
MAEFVENQWGIDKANDLSACIVKYATMRKCLIHFDMISNYSERTKHLIDLQTQRVAL